MEAPHSETSGQMTPIPKTAGDGDLSSSQSLHAANGFSDESPAHFTSEMDGFEVDPVVVCGFSMRFPQEASSPERLWDMMMEKRCAMTEFPPERLNLKGFYDKTNRLNTVRKVRATIPGCFIPSSFAFIPFAFCVRVTVKNL